jgi:hypothetical protein
MKPVFLPLEATNLKLIEGHFKSRVQTMLFTTGTIPEG